LVNGKLKNLKALENIRNTQLGHISIDYRIAAAMLNFTHNPITPDMGKSEIIANRMRKKSQLKKNKLEFILGKTLGTKTIRPIKIKDIIDFPRLKKSVIKDRISLGTFQPRLSKSYIKDVIENSFTFIVESDIIKEIKNEQLKSDLSKVKYKIIVMEILSRHGRGKKSKKNELKSKKIKKLNQSYTKVYKVFILYKPNVNNYTGINAYICSCMSGKRTNGCCVHVATVIYYLSNVVHVDQSQLKYPGSYLNKILVDINSNSAANNPHYVRNGRKLKDIISSSESENDLSSDSDPESSDLDEEEKSDDNKADKKLEKPKVEEKKTELPRKYPLLMTEKQLRNNEWLTDIEIEAFLYKMRDYLELNNITFRGLNDPVLITGLRINSINMRNEHFVEIVNSGNNHWVTISAGSQFDQHDICLFDSMPRQSIDTQLGTTASLLSHQSRLEKGHLIFQVQNVQSQKSDLCGYFALANAMALCVGLDPERLLFTENEIKNHFINIMFHNQNMSMFPYREKPGLRNKKNRHLIFDLKNVQLIERQKQPFQKQKKQKKLYS
jgi:hypothetical protein